MAAVLTYAIGDIHGSFTKIANLLRHCQDHCGGTGAQFVLLGDYIDRGKRSREVVKLLMAAQAADPQRFICLKGNHEHLLVAAARGGDEARWLKNGGDATLDSYGADRAAEIPDEHLVWFDSLPVSRDDGSRFFVHGGIKPGIPLDQQENDVMLLMREPFLSDQSAHGRYIVHGHTPSDTGKPQVFHNRLNLDTMAYSGNPLVAAVFDDHRIGPLAFIADDGSVSPAPPINALEEDRYAAGNRARSR